MSPTLTGLVKKLDEAATKNKSDKMGSWVVVLTDDKDKMEAELKKLADKEGLKKVVLTIESPAGPSGYTDFPTLAVAPRT